MNTTELTEIQIDNLCSEIEHGKLLPFLPYVYTELSSKEFETDNHQPFYYNSNVNIGDNMNGFLYVNMDGFFSNCVNIDEVTHIFNWDSVEEIKIKIDVDRKSCIIALCTEDGMLTIVETNGSSLKIVKAIYDYVWKDVITEFKDSPILMWSNIENMGVKRKVFNTFSELSKYSEEKVKPLKVKKHLEALLKWAKSGNTIAKSKEIIEVNPLQKSNVFIHISYLFFKIKNANEEGLTSSGFEQAKALSLKWIANDKPSMEGIDD